MKLKYTILYVENVPETLKFYEKSFGFQTKMLHGEGDYGELDTGETILAFSSFQLMADLGKNPIKPDPSAPTFELAFETQDVKKSLDRAIKSGAVKSQNTTCFKGQSGFASATD